MSAKVSVTINGITGEVAEGTTLLKAADEIGAGLMHACFGNGLCTTCRVKVVEGDKSLSEKQIKERVSMDYHLCFDPNTRLACQAKVQAGEKIEVVAPKPFSFLAPKPKKKKSSEAAK